MIQVVLDAAALLASIKGERDAAKVAKIIAGTRISAVNHAEVISHFVHADMPYREIKTMRDPPPITVVPVGKALGQLAGR